MFRTGWRRQDFVMMGRGTEKAFRGSGKVWSRKVNHIS